MRPERIVITGIGAITPFGIGKEAFTAGVQQGQSCVKKICTFDVDSLSSKKAAMVSDYRPEVFDGSPRFCRSAKSSQFSLVTTDMALGDARLDKSNLPPTRTGIFLGSDHCALESTERFYAALIEKGPSLTNPLLFQETVSNAPASEISIRYGIKGPSYVITSGMASSGLAISAAIHALRDGSIDIAIAGGVDTLFRMLYQAFSNLKQLSAGADNAEICRPFDRRRNGFILGEGAGIIVLETWHHAHNRDALIQAEVIGEGMSCCHWEYNRKHRATGENGFAFAMIEAIQQSGIQKDSIGYIAAASSGDRILDIEEIRAISSVFQGGKGQIIAGSIKSMIGETTGPGSVLNLIHAVEVLKSGIIPPTLHYERADIDLNFIVPNKTIERPLDYALINSASLTGNCSSILIKKYIAEGSHA